jgi:hypothetical protein
MYVDNDERFYMAQISRRNANPAVLVLACSGAAT